MPEYREIEVPAGNFIGWAARATNPPQTVTIKVLDFDPTGGRDANGNVCPQLTGTIVEDTVSYREKGTAKVDVKVGELVQVTCGLINLKKGLLIANPQRDDLVRLSHVDDVKVSDGTVKVIKTEHAPGAGADSIGEDEL